MQKVTVQFLVNSRKLTKNKKRIVYLRLYDSQKKYFISTGIEVKDAKELEKIRKGGNLTDEQTLLQIKINEIALKATNTIKSISEDSTPFNIEAFKEVYDPAPIPKVKHDFTFVRDAYSIKIAHLIDNKQLKTAQTYDLACKSLTTSKPKLKFDEVTPDFLKSWENGMIGKGRSKTTVSMYVRTLRTLFNDGISLGHIEQMSYPFGRRKYKVPASKNIKKALDLSGIASLYNYDCPTDYQAEAKDYWFFLYLNNGMNVKDMALLKWKDFNDGVITFIRAKTANAAKETEPITIPVSDETKEIIQRRGRRTLSPNDYIFPILTKGMDEGAKMRAVQQAVQNINKNMKKITTALELPKVTTYTARHSYASVLLHSGQSVAFIGKQLGHSDAKTTENYLKSFDLEAKREANAALTSFK